MVKAKGWGRLRPLVYNRMKIGLKAVVLTGPQTYFIFYLLANCPQAASISLPRLRLSLAFTRCFSR